MTTESIGRDDWLQHAAALRRLAASLLGDEHEADDLVQETWLRAREGARREPRWLRTVLRNLVRDRQRARGRREHTERGAARAERLPSEGEVVEQLEVAQRVAAEVARLDEPYRTALHLRYFDDWAPAEIARATEVPLETVRTRLRRGLETLRERMDRAHGGRREAWVLALAPLVARNTGTTASAPLAALGGLMGTKLALTGVAALVVVVGFVLYPRSARPDGSLASAPPIVAPQVLAHDGESSANPVSTPPARREPVLATPTSSAPALDSSVNVHGRVVVEDEGGNELTDESGTLTITCVRGGNSARLQELAFEKGAWGAAVAQDELFGVLKLIVRGREALLPEARPLAPGPEPVVVRGKLVPRGSLRVIDAETKEELRGIEVRCAEGWRGNPIWTHPGDDERVATVLMDVASPFELPDRKWLTPYWVHAPGHAWARVDFDHRTGGQRTLELSPRPASVVVSLVGGTLPADARVRLYDDSDTLDSGVPGIRMRMPAQPRDTLASVSVRAASSGPTRIDDLQAGSFVAALELGTYEETRRFGQAPVEVHPGESASVTIAFDAAALDVPRTHLFGAIAVPAELDLVRASFRLERLGGGTKPFQQRLSEMGVAPGDELKRRWDAGLLPTGEYVAKVSGVEYRQLVHALEPGATEVTIVVPPLATVTVEVVDAVTRAPLEPEHLGWHGPPLEGVRGFEMPRIVRDPRTGRLQFVAAAGEIEVSGSAPGYCDASATLLLDGHDQSCTLELVRATGLHVSLRAGGAPFHAGQEAMARLTITREDGEYFSQWHQLASAAEFSCRLDAPGRYRIEFPAVEGCEPLALLTVEVRAGEILEVPVELVRRP